MSFVDHELIELQRGEFSEKLATESNPLGLSALSQFLFDKPQRFAAFILWLVLDAKVDIYRIISSGIFSRWVVYCISEKEDGDESEETVVRLLKSFQSQYPLIKTLLEQLSQIYCGVRGTEVNYPVGEKFISRNLLNQRFMHEFKFPCDKNGHLLAEYYEICDFEPFSFDYKTNILNIYSLFKKEFLLLLDYKNADHIDAFESIKEYQPEKVIEDISYYFNSKELSWNNIRFFLQESSELFVDYPYYKLNELLLKNIHFFYILGYENVLICNMSKSDLNDFLKRLTASLEQYVPIVLLSRLCLTLLNYMEKFSNVWLVKIINILFQSAIHANELSSEEMDVLKKIPDIKRLCYKKLHEYEDVLKNSVKKDKSYQQLHIKWLMNLSSVERIQDISCETISEIFYPNDKFQLKAFYIAQCFENQNKNHHFSITSILEEFTLYHNNLGLNFGVNEIKKIYIHIFSYAKKLELMNEIFYHLENNFDYNLHDMEALSDQLLITAEEQINSLVCDFIFIKNKWSHEKILLWVNDLFFNHSLALKNLSFLHFIVKKIMVMQSVSTTFIKQIFMEIEKILLVKTHTTNFSVSFFSNSVVVDFYQIALAVKCMMMEGQSFQWKPVLDGLIAISESQSVNLNRHAVILFNQFLRTANPCSRLYVGLTMLKEQIELGKLHVDALEQSQIERKRGREMV